MKKLLKDPLFWIAILAFAQMMIGAFASHILFLCGCLSFITAIAAKCLTILQDIRLNQLLQIRDMFIIYKHLLEEQHQANKAMETAIKKRVRNIKFKMNRL